MKKIPLTQGKFAIVDDEDYYYLSRFHWSTGGDGQANREFMVNKKAISIPMWKFVLQAGNFQSIRFINRNCLDNQKSNLQLVDISMANHTDEKKKAGYLGQVPTSKYKGVSYCKTYLGYRKWVTCISRKGKKFVKHFYTEEAAAEWYNEKAQELYGELAYQNIIT